MAKDESPVDQSEMEQKGVHDSQGSRANLLDLLKEMTREVLHGDEQSDKSVLQRTKSAIVDRAPRVRLAARSASVDVMNWMHRGGPWRAFFVTVVSRPCLWCFSLVLSSVSAGWHCHIRCHGSHGNFRAVLGHSHRQHRCHRVPDVRVRRRSVHGHLLHDTHGHLYWCSCGGRSGHLLGCFLHHSCTACLGSLDWILLARLASCQERSGHLPGIPGHHGINTLGSFGCWLDSDHCNREEERLNGLQVSGERLNSSRSLRPSRAVESSRCISISVTRQE